MQLPAAIATSAAIPAIAVPATPPSAASATASRPPSATAIAAAATPSAGSSSTSAATLTRRTSFIDYNVAAHEIVTVQSLNGALGFLVAIYFDKSEPAWLA